ncbi:MAG: pitrilysin family protein [Candidatus Saccharimonadales bacterium]
MKHIVTEVELRSGARGLLIHVPGAQVMSTRVQFRAGTRYVRDKSIEETAHIMEHMAFGANARFKDAAEYDAEFTKNGAYFNATTADYSMVYMTDCADFEWDRILELQQLSITKPRFIEEELKSEAGNVRNELNGYLNNHMWVLWSKMGQVLGEDILTWQERIKTIGNVTVADIREHYRRTHTLANMRFVIAGHIHGREQQIKDMLSSWELPEGERLSVPVDELHRADPLLIKRKEATNFTFGLSMVVPRRLSDAEIDAMQFADHILNGTFRSRIFGGARKKGLAYGMWSNASANEHNSTWDFGTELDPESAPELFELIAREVRAVINGEITDEEVEAARQYALGRHQMGAQTAGQINNWYADRYFFDGRINDYDVRPSEIEAVTRDRIVETAREFINADCWLLGGIGNVDKAFVDSLHEKLVPLFEK